MRFRSNYLVGICLAAVVMACNTRPLNDAANEEQSWDKSQQQDTRESKLGELFRKLSSAPDLWGGGVAFLGESKTFGQGQINSLVVPSLDQSVCNGVFLSTKRIESRETADAADFQKVQMNDRPIGILKDWGSGGWFTEGDEKYYIDRAPHIYRLTGYKATGIDDAKETFTALASFQFWGDQLRSRGSRGFYLAIVNGQGESVPRYSNGFIGRIFLNENGLVDANECLANKKIPNCEEKYGEWRDQNYIRFGSDFVKKDSGWAKAYIAYTFSTGFQSSRHVCDWKLQRSQPECGTAISGTLTGLPAVAFQIVTPEGNSQGLPIIYGGFSEERWTSVTLTDPLDKLMSSPNQRGAFSVEGYVPKGKNERKNVILLNGSRQRLSAEFPDSIKNLVRFDVFKVPSDSEPRNPRPVTCN